MNILFVKSLYKIARVMLVLYIGLQAKTKLVTFNYRDPPWMNDFAKSKIKQKNQLYKIYTKNGYNYNDYLWLKEATVLVSQVIAKRKEDYHNIIASELSNPKTNAKAHWSFVKTFYNGEKIPVIPPLLINSELISNFKIHLSWK